MYSDSDLDAAVEQGALSASAAASFRAFVAGQRAAPAVDEEHFRLITGFNDIFVSIAAILLLTAISWLAGAASPVLGSVAIIAVSWALAEYFTRRRRMALPSILLLGSFALGAFWIGMVLGKVVFSAATDTMQMMVGAVLAVVVTIAHWRRFRVPITIAVGACAAVTAVVTLMIAMVPGLAGHWVLPLFVGGIALFVLAMRWDVSDRTRTTRRSDVAFWLHLAAAPLIVHPVFALLGLLGGGDPSLGRAAVAVGLYALLAIVALVVDRRALLVSALFYVVYAMCTLLQAAGALHVSFALTGVVIGSALLLLSAFWHVARRAVLRGVSPRIRGWVPAA